MIIGAGSVEFTRELLGDIFSFPDLGAVRVVLHDIDTERLETATAIAHATAHEAGTQPEVVATTDRRRALDGADYVINVIQVGMHEATSERTYFFDAETGDARRSREPVSL